MYLIIQDQKTGSILQSHPHSEEEPTYDLIRELIENQFITKKVHGPAEGYPADSQILVVYLNSHPKGFGRVEGRFQVWAVSDLQIKGRRTITNQQFLGSLYRFIDLYLDIPDDPKDKARWMQEEIAMPECETIRQALEAFGEGFQIALEATNDADLANGKINR